MSFKKNIINTVFVHLIRLCAGFGVTLLLARYLKPEGMGLLTIFLTVPMMICPLAEMGIPQAIASTIGKSETGILHISKALSTIWLCSSLLSFLGVLIAYHYQGLFTYGWFHCLIGALFVPSTLVRRFGNGIALGKQWIRIININEICNIALRILLVLIFVILMKMSVIGALLMNVISILLPGIWLIYWITKKLNLKVELTFDKDTISKLVFQGFKYALPLFLIIVNYRINILILQQYVDEAQIGYFSVGVRLAELIWLFPTAVGLVIFSYSTGTETSLDYSKKIVQIMRLNFFLCAIGALILGLICPFFVNLVFGEEYIYAVPAIRWMLPGIAAMVIFKILRIDMAGRGKPLFAFPAVLLTLVVNLILNFILVPKYGIQGSSIATSVSYLTGALGLMLYYSKETGIKLRTMFLSLNDDIRLLSQSYHSFKDRLWRRHKV